MCFLLTCYRHAKAGGGGGTDLQHGVRVLQHGGRHERAALAVPAALELEEVALGYDEGLALAQLFEERHSAFPIFGAPEVSCCEKKPPIDIIMRVIIEDEGRARWLAGGLELMFGVLVRMRPLIMRVLTEDAGQGVMVG